MSRGKPSALRAFAGTLSGSTIAAIALAVVTSAGGDDLGAFVWWTLPFALLVALASRLGLARLPHPRARLAVAAVAGAIGGVLWTILVAVALGPFFLLFSFPAALCWIAGGALGAVAATPSASARAARVARAASYGTLGVLLVLLVATTLVAVALDPGADVVARVRTGTSQQQVMRLAERLLDDRAVEGVAHDAETVEVFLADGASDDDRERVRARLARSPIVARVER